jgi:HEPN domain-containing protein
MDNPVHEWIEKAEEDYRVTLALRRLRGHPAHNAVCFHAQQCVEKYLKAILEKHGIPIRKIHALPVLLEQCCGVYPLLASIRPEMIRLSAYAVEFRYPGESAAEADAREAVRMMKHARMELRDIIC